MAQFEDLAIEALKDILPKHIMELGPTNFDAGLSFAPLSRLQFELLLALRYLRLKRSFVSSITPRSGFSGGLAHQCAQMR